MNTRHLPAFVDWFRRAAPYVHQHRDQTFVIHIAGDLLDRATLDGLMRDFALLNALGMRLVIVYSIDAKLRSLAREAGQTPEQAGTLCATDREMLRLAGRLAGETRLELEALLSRGLPNTPMSGSVVRVTSGNYITAKPAGVINGVDLQYTGLVRRIDATGINAALSHGSIVLVPPVGHSVTGEMFNMSSAQIAQEMAGALKADKLLFLLRGALSDAQGQLVRELSTGQAREWLENDTLEESLREPLSLGICACDHGVSRVHFIDQGQDGALLMELFSRDGIATLLTVAAFDDIRPARTEDISGILQLIQPLAEQGLLLPRPRDRLEDRLSDFTVLMRDGMVIACAALRHHTAEHMMELECLAVHSEYHGRGKGRILHDHLQWRAAAAGAHHLYVLTTQAIHWFRELGYEPADIGQLPAERAAEYKPERGSKILIKPLT